MNHTVLIGALILGVLALGVLIYFMMSGGSSRGLGANYRNLTSNPRESRGARSASDRDGGKPDLLKGLEVPEGQARKVKSAQLNVRKRLKYAQLPIPPVAFHSCEIAISLAAFLVVRLHMNVVMQLISLLAGPLFMRWFLNTMMDRRFKRFDADYPQFLLSLVGLLKTGMNPMGALEAAAQGLEEGSLVKEECEMMIERLRFGVSEDKSIGAFGEDVFHPEIELFVQALLLSRRVGGTLSDTLERLAKQVRKRQHFRNSAVAAVGMQRGSIWIIIFMLFAMQFYLYLMYPQMVVGGLQSEMGWEAWQVGIAVILLGIFWVRQVTKIKV